MLLLAIGFVAVFLAIISYFLLKDKRNNRLAIASFIVGIVSALFLHIIGFIAILLGTMALHQLGKNDKEKGKWMAVTGLILGILYAIMYLTGNTG